MRVLHATGKEFSDFLKNHKVEVLRWPENNPDLNHIENL